jgi:hypothetical protein
MPIPTWSVGEILASADVNAWFVDEAAYTTVAQHAVNTTTLASITSLALPVAANALYQWDLYLLYDGGTFGASDLKVNFTVPASTTAAFQILDFNASGASPGVDVRRLGFTVPLASAVILGTQGAGSLCSAAFGGTVDTAATAGNMQPQFAQNTAFAAVDTVIHIGSSMTLRRIG